MASMSADVMDGSTGLAEAENCTAGYSPMLVKAINLLTLMGTYTCITHIRCCPQHLVLVY